MMYAAFFIIIALLLFVIIVQDSGIKHMSSEHKDERDTWHSMWNAERLTWQHERKELMDRIQAPSFAEYKQAEVKMVKAQKDEQPAPTFHLE